MWVRMTLVGSLQTGALTHLPGAEGVCLDLPPSALKKAFNYIQEVMLDWGLGALPLKIQKLKDRAVCVHSTIPHVRRGSVKFQRVEQMFLQWLILKVAFLVLDVSELFSRVHVSESCSFFTNSGPHWTVVLHAAALNGSVASIISDRASTLMHISLLCV